MYYYHRRVFSFVKFSHSVHQRVLRLSFISVNNHFSCYRCNSFVLVSIEIELTQNLIDHPNSVIKLDSKAVLNTPFYTSACQKSLSILYDKCL
jgi:hypothetical protein